MENVNVFAVASAAGVSIATVSRVINTPGKVREDTRRRVLAAIDELGFEPKPSASERARKSGGRIAVLAPFFASPSSLERFRGVLAALRDSPYELVVFNVESSQRRDARLVNAALSRRLEGLLVLSLPFDDESAARLKAHGVETVLVEFSRPSFCAIIVDNEGGGRLAAAHLASRGRRRCAFLGDGDLPDLAPRVSDERLRGFRAGLAEAGLALPESLVSRGAPGLESSMARTQALLDGPEPPDAIFAASDELALGALKAARRRGVRVPDDLAIMGFDDLPVADYIGLTTIRQPLAESGRIAVELLISRLEDRGRNERNIELPLSVVVRETA